MMEQQRWRGRYKVREGDRVRYLLVEKMRRDLACVAGTNWCNSASNPTVTLKSSLYRPESAWCMPDPPHQRKTLSAHITQSLECFSLTFWLLNPSPLEPPPPPQKEDMIGIRHGRGNMVRLTFVIGYNYRLDNLFFSGVFLVWCMDKTNMGAF